MKKELSAGGVVYTIRKKKGKKYIMWLICQHSQHKGWVFPKGLVGDFIENESKEDTAVREVKEETGINAEIVHKKPIVVSYWYQFQNERIFKTVYYYLMRSKGGNFQDRDHEMMAVEWKDEEGVKKTLTYPSDKKAFEEALTLFDTISKSASVV